MHIISAIIDLYLGIRLMIDLKDASYFLRLCQTKNLTQSAKILNISPSTLSRIISRLEDYLGVSLCKRDPKGIEITKEGYLFAAFAKKCLKDYQKLTSEFEGLKNNIKGHINLYCSVTASFVYVPTILTEMKLTLPNLDINLITGDPANALAMLDTDYVDFVVAPLPEDYSSEYIDYVHLSTFPLVLTGSKEDIWSNDELDISTISQKPFIMCSHGLLRTKVQDFLKTHNINPVSVHEVAGHEAMVCMSALGFGLTVVPKLVADLSPYRGSIRMKEYETLGSFKVCLCYKKERYQKQMNKMLPFIELVDKLSSGFIQSVR